MTLLSRNTATSHGDIASHVTASMVEVTDLSAMDRFQQYGDAAMSFLNAIVTRQAAMVAYIDDFYLMMWLSFLSVPLVFFMRKNTIHSRR